MGLTTTDSNSSEEGEGPTTSTSGSAQRLCACTRLPRCTVCAADVSRPTAASAPIASGSRSGEPGKNDATRQNGHATSLDGASRPPSAGIAESRPHGLPQALPWPRRRGTRGRGGALTKTSSALPATTGTGVPVEEQIPRRLPHRVGPLRLYTPRALVCIDVLACTSMWVVLGRPGVAFLVQAIITLSAFGCLQLYRQRLNLGVLDDLPRLFAGVLVGALVPAALDPWGPLKGAHSTGPAGAATLLFVVTTLRYVGFVVARRVRRRGDLQHVAVILGAGRVGIRLATSLQEHAEYGMSVVGYIDSDPRIEAHEALPAPLLGGYEALAELIDDFNVTHVLVAFGTLREEALVDILRTCGRMDVEVMVVPRLFELHSAVGVSDEVWGLPLIPMRRAAFRSPWWPVKRLFDVVVSLVAVVLLLPVMVFCAVAVRLEGGRGVIFKQQRVGLDDRSFQLLKFRSLRPADEAESRTRWNVKHDDRLGPVGRFLRSSSLDELPQLWNILRGDMSLVGPRPERPHFVQEFAKYIPRYTARHRVPAGLTGWAQVHGLRGDTSIEERARFDNYYIENWSPWLDCKILCRTVGHLLGRHGG